MNNNRIPSKTTSFIALLRPKQWTKNLLLLAGLIFSANLLQPALLSKALLALLSFCLLSSSVYIINDLADLEEDRKHPRKRLRPLAAGQLTKKEAYSTLVVTLICAVALALTVNLRFLLICAFYFALSLAYSFRLKYIVILDVFAIAFGFLLRAVAGGAAIHVEISPWLLLCTLFLSLFLALAKRRQESANIGRGAGGGNGGEEGGSGGEQAAKGRSVLEHYPLPFLDQLLSVVTTATILAYSTYTFTASSSPYFMLTIPFVIYGVFRYLYLVHNKNLGESPEEILLTDPPMIINIILWLLSCILIINP